MKFKQICETIEDTKKLAQKFAPLIKNGCFINLYGEIGAGKTGGNNKPLLWLLLYRDTFR